MINKTNIENLNFVIKKNLNQNNYLQLDFPYLDQYIDWYKFKIKFWRYINDAFNDFSEARRVFSDIYTYPKTYINSVVNNPIEFDISINSIFEVSLKEMKFKDLNHYMNINLDDVKKIDRTNEGFFELWECMVNSLKFINNNPKNITNPLITTFNSINSNSEKSTNIKILLKDENLKELVPINIKSIEFSNYRNFANKNWEYANNFNIDDLHIYFGAPKIESSFTDVNKDKFLFSLFYSLSKRLKIIYFDLPGDNIQPILDLNHYSLFDLNNDNNLYLNFPKSKIDNHKIKIHDEEPDENIDFQDNIKIQSDILPHEDESINDKKQSFKLILSSDKKYYVPINSSIQTIDLNITDDIKSKKIEDIEIGDWILIRHGKDSDYIKDISDKLLNAKDPDILINQHEWKSKLRHEINKFGHENIINKLDVSVNLDKNVLQTWATEDENLIGPQNESNFKQILSILDLDKPIEKYIESKNSIFESRIESGKIVTNKLKKSGNKINDEIHSKSIIKLILDDLDIELHALKIDDISELNSDGNSYYIDTKQIRKLIDIHSW